MALCVDCFNKEEVEHRLTHQFLQYSLVPASSYPDDLKSQLETIFRCTQCSLVTDSAPYSHEHFMFNMHIGAAIIDFRRNKVIADCIGNKLKAKRLPEPPNPTAARCTICAKLVAFNVWNKLCISCDSFICKACIDANRTDHRHPLHWTWIVRVGVADMLKAGPGAFCDACGQRYYNNTFTGLVCLRCNNFHHCFPCVKLKRLPTEHLWCQGQLSSWNLRIE